jgi:hypothetical protein
MDHEIARVLQEISTRPHVAEHEPVTEYHFKKCSGQTVAAQRIKARQRGIRLGTELLFVQPEPSRRSGCARRDRWHNAMVWI